MAEVESFTLDHTAVKAPYVRLISVTGEGGRPDRISTCASSSPAAAKSTSGLHDRAPARLCCVASSIAVRLPHGLPPHHVLPASGDCRYRLVAHAIAEEATWEGRSGNGRPLLRQLPRSLAGSAREWSSDDPQRQGLSSTPSSVFIVHLIRDTQ